MKKSSTFTRLLFSLMLALACSLSAAVTEELPSAEIGAQPLARALRAFAEQFDVQIVYAAELVLGKQSATARWSLQDPGVTALDVLQLLLADTGLEYLLVNKNTIALRRVIRPPAESTAPQVGGTAPSSQQIIENIIVTGVGGNGWQTRFDASYAISAIESQAIEKRAPRGLAEVLAEVPGMFVESSGGVLGNNVYFRGLPNDNFRYVRILEDGLPTFEEGAGTFTNADIFSRIDDTVKNIEIVRSSSAAVTASNSPGSTVNIITRKGTVAPKGQLTLGMGEHDLYRVDFQFSGPVTENLLYHVGGFQLSDGGIRDPGFTANSGGQVRAGLNLALGESDVYLGFKRISDTSTFYPALPMASSRRGLAGLDPGTGSMVSQEFSNLSIYDGIGNKTGIFDVSDGVQTRVNTLDFFLDRTLGDWQLSNKLRHVSGHVDFNAVFSGSNNFEDLDDELLALQAEAPATAALRFSYLNGDGALLRREQLPNGILVDQGIWQSVVELDNLINDFRLVRRAVRADGSSNEVTLGLYYSQFDQAQAWNWQSIISEARHRPRLLDLVGVDSSGQQTIKYTDQGIWNHHSNLQKFEDDVVHKALYFIDTWQLDEAWRMDFGLRYQRVSKQGKVALTEEINLGDPATLADNAVAVFTGEQRRYRFADDELAWTLGLNYRSSTQLSLFARYSEAFRFTPAFAQWFSCCQPTESGITLLELGLKYSESLHSAYLVVFANDFPRIAVSNQRVDAQGNIVTETADAAAQALGLEWELAWHPQDFLELQFSGFYQSIQYADFARTGGAAGGGLSLARGFGGNQILRQPRSVMTLRPVWYFGENNHQLFAALHYTGLRYADAANSIKLPAYSTLDMGLLFNLTDSTQVQLLATNLTDEIGITEGAPRRGAIESSASNIFYGRPIFGRDIRLSLRLRF
ncbi:MAG: TonB-dependent receptor [Gammaproteobacteria bacterium]|nr:TonB-dependent receptor [Gammaproteobacteria bacterium]